MLKMLLFRKFKPPNGLMLLNLRRRHAGRGRFDRLGNKGGNVLTTFLLSGPNWQIARPDTKRYQHEKYVHDMGPVSFSREKLDKIEEKGVLQSKL